MKLRVVTDPAELNGLEDPWRQLAHRCAARPFQEFGWSAAWLCTLGRAGGRRLVMPTLWEGEILRATLPLTIRRYKAIRLLEWLGARATDYCDALVDPAIDPEAAIREMWQAVERGGGFDIARLGQVRTDARIYGLLSSLDPWVETREEAVGIPLNAASGEEWLQSQNAKKRGQVRLGLRKMAKMGFAVRVWQPGESKAPAIDALVAQKRAWIAARGGAGFLTEPEGPDFLHAVAEDLATSGSLHLSTVESEQEGIAAVHFGFQHRGVFYYYLPSYDPRWSKFGFGSLLRDSLIMWACDHGFSRFDMLLGDYEYKKHYELTAEPVQTLALPRGARGRFALGVYRWRANRRKTA